MDDSDASYFDSDASSATMEDLVAAEFADEDEQVAQVNVKSKRPRRSLARVDYSAEKKDEFFDGVPGYSDFNRTRKGGDVRPNASKKV